MKKLQLLLVAMFAITVAFAQPEKGDIFLGGSLNFNMGASKASVGSVTAKGPKTLGVGITPRVGYFISNKFVVGVNAGFGLNSSTDKSSAVTVKNSSTSYGGGVFARYYIMPVEKMGLFFEAAAGVNLGSSRAKAGNVTVDGPNNFGISAGITPGIAVYVSKRVALEANYGFLGYNTNTSTTEAGGIKTKSTNGGFGLNLNPNTFRFGVSILL